MFRRCQQERCYLLPAIIAAKHRFVQQMGWCDIIGPYMKTAGFPPPLPTYAETSAYQFTTVENMMPWPWTSRVATAPPVDVVAAPATKSKPPW
jgi:hypothetical protein